ncbi:MAG TPA: glycosyltransferase N-terminal domain-containing protein [Thermoanaerobaculia bacterium]|nr:glycosyltransferase N-terminal domain-containing protein [Thermoanaerobaculia bacterium]
MDPSRLPILPLVKERLFPAERRFPPGVWIQGVSVGEVQTALDLAEALRKKRPALPLLLSASTPAGVALLRRKAASLSGEVDARAFPLDLPPAVKRFFDAVTPRVLVLIETELWPSVLAEAGRREVPVLLASARLSERSLRWYARARGVFSRALQAVTRVLARTEEDAERFAALGIPADRIEVAGDLKLDRPLPPEPPFAPNVRLLAAGRPVLVAGSIADDEVPFVLEILDTLKRSGTETLLLLAPRRPESFRAVEADLVKRGKSVACRSRLEGASETPRPDVFLLDSLGELGAAYRLGDVAILGGTFVPIGGHNLVEPLRAGLPTVLGPSRFGIRHLVEAAEGAAFPAPHAAGAAEIVAALLGDPSRRREAVATAERLFARQAGALDRAASAILDLLGDAE